METYNTKIVNFGDYQEITTFQNMQLKEKGSNNGGGRHLNSVISDEAQEERTKAQEFGIKRKIRHYVLANDFTHFVTLTIDPNRYDSLDFEVAKKMLLNWLKKRRAQFGKFDYIFIPEMHKSGRVHFHGVLGNVEAFTFVEAINPKTKKSVVRNGRQVYNLKNWKYGFSDCELIVSKEKTASYITKYITKELLTNSSMFGKKRYFPSRGLKTPTVSFETFDDNTYSEFTPNYGVLATDETGKTVFDRTIYKLHIDKETGEIIQENKDSLIKMRKEQP